jgi:hypothetical protein
MTTQPEAEGPLHGPLRSRAYSYLVDRTDRAERGRRADADELQVWHWQNAWELACEYVGLCHHVLTVSGPTIVTPKAYAGSVNPPYLMVQLLPGQLPQDLSAHARRLSATLGVAGLRVTPRTDAYVRVDLLMRDPLADVFSMPGISDGPVFIGVDEQGRRLTYEPPQFTHVVVQGATGSGKSVWTYGLLSQLAGRLDVLVTGCDPSGLLFRPFVGSRHADWQASGVADPERFAKVLISLVDEMDERILMLPADTDQLQTASGQPLIFVLLEEIAGLYRVCDQGGKELGKLVRSLIGRLLAEGRKAGIRVVMIVQRAEAAVIGAFERAQCAMRISFGVDSLESVRLLHPAASADMAAEHFAAAPGVALLSAPGLPLLRFRAPLVGDYRSYVDVVRSACLPGPDA